MCVLLLLTLCGVCMFRCLLSIVCYLLWLLVFASACAYALMCLCVLMCLCPVLFLLLVCSISAYASASIYMCLCVVGVALYKCQTLGLLPTSTADWLPTAVRPVRDNEQEKGTGEGREQGQDKGIGIGTGIQTGIGTTTHNNTQIH